MRCFLRTSLVLVACALLSSLAAAQPQEVKDASVKLHARGQVDPTVPATGGTWNETDATGVIVSKDGLVLTAYHLLGKLGLIVPDSLDITADVGGKGVKQKAWVVNSNPYIDVLLLKLERQGQYPRLQLGSAFDLSSDKVHTYGYPATGSFDASGSGDITSRTVDGGYLWGTTFAFANGQSGSPIYDNQNRLIAIAKGEANSQGAIIPIEYADTLLAYLRFQEQRQEIANLRTFFQSATLTETKGDDWEPMQGNDIDLGVAEKEGVCFLVGVIGLFDNAADKVWVEVGDDGIYKLRGENEGALLHGATARCIKYGKL